MRSPALAIALLPALALAACNNSSDKGENADDFAARVNGSGGSADAVPQASAPDAAQEATLAALPRAAESGRSAADFGAQFTNMGADGSESALTINRDGTFELTENGRTVSGDYEWLADGQRIRLRGVEFRPIVVVAADGSLYRLSNEDVPIDDISPDRHYTVPAPLP